jgi:hypothetical protein
MALSLLALGAFMASVAAPVDAASGSAPPRANPQADIQAKVDRFSGRPEARIPFSRNVRNFQVKRDNGTDVLYLETSRDRWYRSEISCFGINDPRDAQGLVPLDRGFGIDGFTRVVLVGFGHRQNECTLRGLIELTQDEAVDLRLVRRRAPTTPPPAS